GLAGRGGAAAGRRDASGHLHRARHPRRRGLTRVTAHDVKPTNRSNRTSRHDDRRGVSAGHRPRCSERSSSVGVPPSNGRSRMSGATRSPDGGRAVVAGAWAAAGAVHLWIALDVARAGVAGAAVSAVLAGAALAGTVP